MLNRNMLVNINIKSKNSELFSFHLLFYSFRCWLTCVNQGGECIRNYCVIVAGKLVTWSEKLSFLLELCSRSESWSWSSFTRIDVDESFKCRTEYRILKYEHEEICFKEWKIKATENWLYIQHLVSPLRWSGSCLRGNPLPFSLPPHPPFDACYAG